MGVHADKRRLFCVQNWQLDRPCRSLDSSCQISTWPPVGLTGVRIETDVQEDVGRSVFSLILYRSGQSQATAGGCQDGEQFLQFFRTEQPGKILFNGW